MQWRGFDDRARSVSGPAIERSERLSLHRWAILLASSDVTGCLVFSRITLDIYSVPLEQLLTVTGGFVLSWGLMAHSQRLYQRATLLACLHTQLLKCTVPFSVTFALSLVLTLSFHPAGGHLHLAVLVWASSMLVWVWALRIVWHYHLRALLDRGFCLERAVLLAASPRAGSTLCAMIEHETRGEVRILCTESIPGMVGSPSSEWIEDAIRVGLIDRIFVAFDSAIPETNAFLARLSSLAVEVTLVPNLQGIEAQALRVSQIGQQPLVDVNVMPLTAMQTLAKRIEDLVIASIALVVALPVFGLVILAIKVDSDGPIFFRQWRAGFHDQRFRVWKFRTMYHELQDDNAVRQTSRSDKRVTRVGKFLRRASLDELPQLLNVISGDMSLVGPRPHALGMTATGQPLHQVMANYSARHRVKPGITGWAQVCGCRGEVTTQEKLRNRVTLDCYYIENWSLAFDLWIILRTFVAIFLHQNAY